MQKGKHKTAPSICSYYITMICTYSLHMSHLRWTYLPFIVTHGPSQSPSMGLKGWGISVRVKEGKKTSPTCIRFNKYPTEARISPVYDRKTIVNLGCNTPALIPRRSEHLRRTSTLAVRAQAGSRKRGERGRGEEGETTAN